MRKGRPTASKHHEIYSKINSALNSKGSAKPKKTPLTAKTMFGGLVKYPSNKMGN